MEEPPRGFGNSLKASTKNWIKYFSIATLILPLVSLIIPGLHHSVVLAVGAGLCFLIASFGVWREQEKRIEKLMVRPYTKEHKQLARKILTNLPDDEKDVLRYLLHFGEWEETQLTSESGFDAKLFRFEILMKAANSGLLKREKRSDSGSAWFCSINPNFADVLEDELFPRPKDPPKRLFPSKPM